VQVNAQIASNQRQLDAAQRVYYIPNIRVEVRYNQNISRSGVGASNSNLLDDDWSANLQASLPLFAGGARQAEMARARNSLRQSQTQYQAQQQQIEAGLLSTIQRAKGSFPAVRLARFAASSAKDNFALITDAYVQGTISITNLIDAQDAALAADLAAAEAQYNFVIDWIAIQRAIANYDVLLSEDGFDQWYEALDRYYQKHARP
jgi:outer membrane protein TolC